MKSANFLSYSDVELDDSVKYGDFLDGEWFIHDIICIHAIRKKNTYFVYMLENRLSGERKQARRYEFKYRGK